jgi:hypothetical protein
VEDHSVRRAAIHRRLVFRQLILGLAQGGVCLREPLLGFLNLVLARLNRRACRLDLGASLLDGLARRLEIRFGLGAAAGHAGERRREDDSEPCQPHRNTSPAER